MARTLVKADVSPPAKTGITAAAIVDRSITVGALLDDGAIVVSE